MADPAVPQPLVVPLFTYSPAMWTPSLDSAPALMHNGIQGWSLELDREIIRMSEPETDGHLHDAHECDEHEHHGDEPGHVHATHECDEHEHHAHDGDMELVAAG